jgi:hypothetical protein
MSQLPPCRAAHGAGTSAPNFRRQVSPGAGGRRGERRITGPVQVGLVADGAFLAFRSPAVSDQVVNRQAGMMSPQINAEGA